MKNKPTISIGKHWLASCAGIALQTISEVGQDPAFAASATGVALSPVLGPLAAAGGAILGYGINRITSAHEKQEELTAATRELLTNHDIALAQAHAIAARLGKYADQTGPGEVADRLRQIARHAGTWWPELVNSPALEDLAPVRDTEIVDLLTAELTKAAPFEIAPAIWREIIAEADARVPGDNKLGPALAGYFADYHHATFRADFVEALKTDFLTGGKAFAAVSLRYFATLASGLHALASTQQEMRGSLSAISGTLEQLREAIAAFRAQPGLPAEITRHLNTTETRLRYDLDVILLGVDEVLQQNETLRTEVLENRTRQHEDNQRRDSHYETLLAAVRGLPSAIAAAQQTAPHEDETSRTARAYNTLDRAFGLPPGTLEKQLPAFAEKLLAAPDTSLHDKAQSEFALKNYPEAERIALQAKDAALAATPLRISDAITAFLLAGQAATEQVQYARALDHYGAAATLTNPERDVLAWAEIQNEIGWLLYRQGKYNEQAALMKHVWQACEAAGYAEDQPTHFSRLLFANSLHSSGNYTEAESEYRAVFAIRQRILGPNHPNTLSCRSGIGLALLYQGRYSEAEVAYRQLTQIEDLVLGPDHPQAWATRNNLALVLLHQGKHAEAEKILNEVLAFRKEHLGPSHPDTLSCQMNLAIVADAQGKHCVAENAFRETLPSLELVSGSEHHDTLKCRLGIAKALFSQGLVAQAELQFRPLIPALERVLGPEHPDTLSSRNNLATTLYSQGKHAGAEAEYRAVLAIQNRVLGPEHPDSLMSQNSLAIALFSQGKLTEAVAEHRAVHATQERFLGPEHPDTSRTCYNLSLVLAIMDRKPEALEYAHRALKGWTKVLGPDHPDSVAGRALLETLETD